MEVSTPTSNETAGSLGMALVLSSAAPLVLLDGDRRVLAASRSFCRTFGLDPGRVVGIDMLALGAGEWDIPELRALLRATVSGDVAIDGHEIDLVRPGCADCRLVLHAHRLDYPGAIDTRIVLAVSDVTADRAAKKLNDDLLGQQQVLFQELQHRVANSLQIIASVLIQSARKVQSEETRFHLHDAHHRVMSIATLQRRLASTTSGDVPLRAYFTDLCDSIGASMIYDPKQLLLTVSVDDSVTSAQQSISLGLIVTELVINALKHAFPEAKPAGRIQVRYEARPSGWALTVEDDGVGMPLDRAVKPGLGSGIIEALSKQLGATVTISAANPGTRISVIHP